MNTGRGMMRVTMDSALMPGSNTPKPPACQIHCWPGCQWRTSSFQVTSSIITRRSARKARVASTALLYCECQVVNSTRPARAAILVRSVSSARVAVGGFSSMTCLPASSASRAMRWRTWGGVQMATTSISLCAISSRALVKVSRAPGAVRPRWLEVPTSSKAGLAAMTGRC